MITLRLLGTVQVTNPESEVPRFRSQRTMGLLGYLVAERRAIRRDHLAALFWPDDPIEEGKGNLRRELYNLSQVLPGCWEIDRVQVRFEPPAAVSVDLDIYAGHERAGEWRAAADMVRGDFLEGISLGDSLEFETWLSGERERWRQRAENVLDQVVEELERQGAYRLALGYARRLLQLMPWLEEAHGRVMRLLALSGQRSAALKQFEQCRRTLAEELGVAVSAETVALYERIKNSTHFSVDNIPAVTTPLIGRDSDLATIAELLADRDVRLITITGMGGVGKTRLALAAAWQQTRGQFKDGVSFVALEALDSTDQIVPAVAQVLHMSLSTGDRRSPRQQLLDFLRPRQLLLVLDNCEHLLDGADIISDMLLAAPRIQILATSRERLRLRAEHNLTLQGLGYGDGREGSPARQLFVVAARRRAPNFRISQEESAYVDRLCRLLEGMPLALEMAASWVDMLPLAEIVAGVEDNQRLLATDLRDIPARHRSLEALFVSAWQVLDSGSRRAFSALSIIPDSFTLEAAGTITGASRAVMAGLASRSLLRFDPESGRYSSHMLMRQFGARQLAAVPDLEAHTREEFALYYLRFLSNRDADWLSERELIVAEEIAVEANNILAAWRLGVEGGHWAALLSALNSLARYLGSKGLVAVTDDLFETTIRRMESDFAEALEQSDNAFLLWHGLMKQRFYLAAGHQDRVGLFERIRASAQARELAGQCALAVEADLLTFEGVIVGNSDPRAAAGYFERALDLKRVLDDEAAVINGLIDLSWYLLTAGRHEESERYNQEALGLFRRMGVRSGIIYSLSFSGRNTADPQLALPHFEEAISLARELNLPHALADMMIAAHEVYLALGKYEVAYSIAQEMAEIVTNFGIDYLVGCTTQKEYCAMHLGDYGGAVRMQQVLAKCVMAGDRHMIANQNLYLGQLAAVNESPDQALDHLDAALEIYRSLEHPKTGHARVLKALVLLELGQTVEAERIIRPLLGEAAGQTELLTVLVAAALLLARTGRPEQALAIYGRAEAHPMIANSTWFRDVAGRKIASAAAGLAAETAAASRARFRWVELAVVARELPALLG